ncbi:UNVERIFIED_CONTAM: hypothetical protein GTU68_054677 [Idotea baltica]|nr:hypothetical protein [Idotea baltica]MCL4159681.1 hypothetical protein [Idotea baltica]
MKELKFLNVQNAVMSVLVKVI